MNWQFRIVHILYKLFICWETYHFANALRLCYGVDAHNSIFRTRISLAMIDLYFTSIAFKTSNTITPIFGLFVTGCSLIGWMTLATYSIDTWRRKTRIRHSIDFTTITFESFRTKTFETFSLFVYNFNGITTQKYESEIWLITSGTTIFWTRPEIVCILTMTTILARITFACITIIPNLRFFWTIFVNFRFTLNGMIFYIRQWWTSERLKSHRSVDPWVNWVISFLRSKRRFPASEFGREHLASPVSVKRSWIQSTIHERAQSHWS